MFDKTMETQNLTLLPIFGDNDPISDSLAKIVEQYNISKVGWSQQEMVEAIRQAIPDFTRFCSKEGQRTVYIPGQEAERYKRLYNELLFAVETVFEDESRHETALRYIRQAENQDCQAMCNL